MIFKRLSFSCVAVSVLLLAGCGSYGGYIPDDPYECAESDYNCRQAEYIPDDPYECHGLAGDELRRCQDDEDEA